MTPEGRIKAHVRSALRTLNHVWSFMPVMNGMGKATLDFILCVGGVFVAIETKRPGGKLTARQEATVADMRGAGALVFVVDDLASLEQCMLVLRNCDACYQEAREAAA